MEEMMRLSPRGAESIWDWMKSFAVALAAALALFAACDFADTVSLSGLTGGSAQAARKLLGSKSQGERAVEAILAAAADEAELPGLARVRIWSSDRWNSSSNINGLFNPIFYKIMLGREVLDNPGSDDHTWIVLHEAGHAAHFLTSRWSATALPEWGLPAGSARIIEQSLLYRQTYAESFAELFALAMAARLAPSNAHAAQEMRDARSRQKMLHISIAHDSQAVFRLASERMNDLSTWRGKRLLALIDSLAIRATVLTVGEWGAEREAICLEGVWGWSRWALDWGHARVSNPWRMASDSPPSAGEPRGSELASLVALTPATERGWKRRRAKANDAPGYIERAAQGGSPPYELGVELLPLLRESLSRPARRPESFSREEWMGWARGRFMLDIERDISASPRTGLALPLAWIARAAEGPRPEGCVGR